MMIKQQTVMKKIIFITLFAITVCQSSFCREKRGKTEVCGENTVEQLFKDFAKKKNTTHLKIGSFAMFLINIFKDTKGVSNTEIFSFDECEKKVKDDFNEAIKNLKDKDYETVISTSENREITKVLLKIKDDYISEIVVICSGDDPAMIRIKGKIRQDVIKKNKYALPG
jgi:hypothetical protein